MNSCFVIGFLNLSIFCLQDNVGRVGISLVHGVTSLDWAGRMEIRMEKKYSIAVFFTENQNVVSYDLHDGSKSFEAAARSSFSSAN